MEKFKYIKEFTEAVFPDTKLPEGEVTIPEDIVPLYRLWCVMNGKEVE